MKNRKEYNLNYFKKNPWAKTYKRINARCNIHNPYGKKGIKNLLTTSQLKFIWFRDKAYLLKQPSIDRINSKGNYELSNCRYIELLNNVAWNRGLHLSDEHKRKIGKANSKY